MDRLLPIIRSRFKKHWKAIACQIYAVNSEENSKRGFLFDLGKIDVPGMVDILGRLKKEGIIRRDLMIVKVKEDFFILNPSKFQSGGNEIVVDVSESLEKPRKIEDLREIRKMLEIVRNQILKLKEEEISVNVLEVPENVCIPTIFGYLINYPIIYYLNPQSDSNCLSLVDLTIHQVISYNEILVSFSIPSEIFSSDLSIQKTIKNFLSNFPNHEIKTFTANYPTIVL